MEISTGVGKPELYIIDESPDVQGGQIWESELHEIPTLLCTSPLRA